MKPAYRVTWWADGRRQERRFESAALANVYNRGLRDNGYEGTVTYVRGQTDEEYREL